MSNMSGHTREGTQFHFDPTTYLQYIRHDVPEYDEIQETIAQIASSNDVKRFLDLGAGTGETAIRIIQRFPEAEAVLVEEQARMVALLRERFRTYHITYCRADFGQTFPDGPYCAAVSAFAIHHIKGKRKKELFQKIYASLEPGGLWVFGDVYLFRYSSEPTTPLDLTHDFPSTMRDIETWLSEVGFTVRNVWHKRDLAIYACQK